MQQKSFGLIFNDNITKTQKKGGIKHIKKYNE